MVSPAVLLFDVDGTLLEAAGGGRRALEAAFQQVFDRPDALDHVDFRGMTDARILRAGADAIGRKLDERTRLALIESEARGDITPQQRRESVLEVVDHLQQRWESLDVRARRILLQYIIDRIVVYDDREEVLLRL